MRRRRLRGSDTSRASIHLGCTRLGIARAASCRRCCRCTTCRVRYGGSSGGLYGTSLFDAMAGQVPFVAGDKDERELRVLVGNQHWMKRQHYAYVGAQDGLQDVAGAAAAPAADRRLLSVTVMPGDHMSSLRPSVAAFVQVLKTTP